MRRGYKIGTLRGLMDFKGIIEEIAMSSIERNDLKLCGEMLRKSEHLQAWDILINDRGFISRDMINYLKGHRGVDVYIPAKSNMHIYREAVSIATEKGKWQNHPNAKRKDQKISYVGELGKQWKSEKPEEDVEINVCVVHDEKAKNEDREYYVFMTTDTGATARQIIKTYELRPEIEEDYRQLKEYWRIEEFYSTKYLEITYHNVMVLIGYLWYQLYVEGHDELSACKSLPVALKNYVPTKKAAFVVYASDFFAVFGFLELLHLYSSLEPHVRDLLDFSFISV